jgi:xanthine dehydrogenase accessory factor
MPTWTSAFASPIVTAKADSSRSVQKSGRIMANPGFNPGLNLGPLEAAWPQFGLVDDVRNALAQARASAQPCALITLISADGPAPRGLGAQIVLTAAGAAAGYVSGGCVEGALVAIARAHLSTAAHCALAPERLVFGRGSPYADVRLLCGARIELIVEAIAPDDASIAGLLKARRDRRSIWREVGLDTPGPATLRAAEGPFGPPCQVSAAIVQRRYDPVTRLCVVGRDPIGLALAQMASAIGLETVLIRPLGPVEGPPFAAAAYLTDAPSAALHSVGLDAFSAVVATTHDLDEDHDALRSALSSDAFYVGALGTRRRRKERLDKLAREGLGEAVQARLRAPVGLDIGARSPFEIAIAILADIIIAHRKLRP